MTRRRPNEPLWPRAGRSGMSAAAMSSSSFVAPDGNGAVCPGPDGAADGISRRPNPTGLRSGIGPVRLGLGGSGSGGSRPCRIAFGAHPLDPGEDPPLTFVETVLDVGREEISPTRCPDPE